MSVTSESAESEAIPFVEHDAHLSSDLEGEPPYKIHGIAIGEGDVTRGASGIKKKWPKEALKPAAETLEGKPLVEDHENSSRSVVGKVVEAAYKDDVGVLYEAELFDKDLAEKISNDLLEVSIRGFHGSVEDMEESEEGAKIVEELKFDNLSIVPRGAAPSNTVEIGPSENLTAAECAEIMTEVEETPEGEELQLDEGDLVQWENAQGGQSHGVIKEIRDDRAVAEDEHIGDSAVEPMPGDPVAIVQMVKEKDGEVQNIGVTVAKHLSAFVGWSPSGELPGDIEEGRAEGAEEEYEGETDPDSYANSPERYPEGRESPDLENASSEENESSENMSEAELQDVAVHEPDWDDTRKAPWNEPSLSDIVGDKSWDDLNEQEKQEVASHFLVSKSGEWPPEDFQELALPVVDSEGNLVLNALQNAKARAGQVSGVGDDEEAAINDMINQLANDNFPDANFGEEAAKHHHKAAAEQIPKFLEKEGNSRETFVSAFVEWADDDLVRQAVDEFVSKEGNSLESPVGDLEDWLDEQLPSGDDEAKQERHAIDIVSRTATAVEFADGRIVSVHPDAGVEELRDRQKTIESTSDDEEGSSESEAGAGGEPDTNVSTITVLTGDNTMSEDEITEEELTELRRKAEQYEEMDDLREQFENDLEELKERTAVLDEVDRDAVDELREADDPMVIESERFEELERQVDDVRAAYADALADHVGLSADRLEEKFDISELREELEEALDEEEEVEEELTPDPNSQDPEEEEELEDDSGEEELSEEIKQKQEELREKIRP